MSSVRYFVICAIFAILALPLALRFVPMNSFYGFRAGKALSDTAIWYSANSFLGWAIFIAAGVSVALMLFVPQSITAQSWFAITALFAPLLVAILVSVLFLSRVS